jgi:hypothetical protein
MNTDDLIKTLAGELKPREAVHNINKRFFLWLTISFIAALFVILLHRISISENILHVAISDFGKFTVWMIISVISFRIALKKSIPGIKYSIHGIILALAALAYATCFGFSEISAEMFKFSTIYNSYCLQDIIFSGILSAIFIFYPLQKGYILEKKSTGFFAALSASSIAAGILLLFCERTDLFHELYCHLFPVLLISVLGIPVGKFVFSMNSR